MEKYADFDSKNPWVARLWINLPELLNQTEFNEINKQDIANSIHDICEQLSIAFESLQKIKSDQNLTVLTKESAFQNAYSALWRAYSDRFQTTCQKIGYDIGFLFEKNLKFEKDSIEFIKQHPEIPDDFRKILKIDRKIWQNGFADFRNQYIEHKQISHSIKNVYYKLDMLESIFNNVWQAIEDSLAFFINVKLLQPYVLEEIPEKIRDKSCPKRFKIKSKT
ncbi:hypothetical protein ACFL14_00370 [Patescibacteria group bacterium]